MTFITFEQSKPAMTVEIHNMKKLFNLLHELEGKLDEGQCIEPDTEDAGALPYDGKLENVTLHQRIEWLTTSLNVAIIEAETNDRVVIDLSKAHAGMLADKLTLIFNQCLPGGSWPGVDIWLAPGGVLDEVNDPADAQKFDDLMLMNPDEDACPVLFNINKRLIEQVK